MASAQLQHWRRLRNAGWAVLEETDEDNQVTDMMGIRHTYTENIHPPVDEGVEGLLLMMGNPGAAPPMPFDYSDEWTVVVRGGEMIKFARI